MDLTTIKSVWSKMDKWIANLSAEASLPDSVSYPVTIGLSQWYHDQEFHPYSYKSKGSVVKLSSVKIKLDDPTPLTAIPAPAGIDSYVLPLSFSKLFLSGNFIGTENLLTWNMWKRDFEDLNYSETIDCQFKFTIEHSFICFLVTWRDSHLVVDLTEIPGEPKVEYLEASRSEWINQEPVFGIKPLHLFRPRILLNTKFMLHGYITGLLKSLSL